LESLAPNKTKIVCTIEKLKEERVELRAGDTFTLTVLKHCR
jgi:hypothetical protein